MDKITMSERFGVWRDLRDLLASPDPRTAGWPLVDNPSHIAAICLAYLLIVKVVGPRLMASRAPFDLRGLIFIYDFAMVLISAAFFIYGGSLTYFWDYSFICQPIDYSNSERNQKILHLCWWYLVLKIFEFSDTLFFVLRKKTSHVSALHVTHHAVVVSGVWLGLRYGAGGQNAFFPFVNCAVHVVMYSYYCIATLGNKRCLWWKRYLTQLQMMQFVVAFLHAALPLVVDCGFRPGFSLAVMAHAVLFFVMFAGFYRERYGRRKKSVAIQSTDDNLNELLNEGNQKTHLEHHHHHHANGKDERLHASNNGESHSGTNGIATTDASASPQPQYLYSYVRRNRREQEAKEKRDAAKGRGGKKRR